MKRFEFSLARVLEFKQRRKKLAEADQRRALAALTLVQQEIARAQGQLRHVAETLAQRIADGIELTMWIAFNQESVRLGQHLKELEQKEIAASQQVDQANSRRKKITVEVEALLTLKREQWQAYRRAFERKAQEHLDDLGLRRWQDAQTKEGVS